MLHCDQSYLNIYENCLEALSDLVDKVLPVLDEVYGVLVAVFILCQCEHSARTPQIQLPDGLSDGHLTLGSLV